MTKRVIAILLVFLFAFSVGCKKEPETVSKTFQSAEQETVSFETEPVDDAEDPENKENVNIDGKPVTAEETANSRG